jgi:hypothetical protein
MAEYIHLINGKEIAAANVVPGTPLASALEAISAGAYRIVPLTSTAPYVPNPAGASPAVPLSAKIIYLTKDSSAGLKDPYTEWIYTGDTTIAVDPTKWEIIGETSPDMSSKEDKANKVTTIRADGTATNTAYPSEAAVRTELDTKADKIVVEQGEDPTGHIPELDNEGNLVDSEIEADDLVTDVHIDGEQTSLVYQHVATIPTATDYTAGNPATGATAVESSWGVVKISTIIL